MPTIHSTAYVLDRARRHLIPPLREAWHKGQLGRVAVLGGSVDYTGAPYFSAMASARLGCDMSHVICTPGAGAVIKTYSPNLMVHPLLRESHDLPPPSSSSSSSSGDEGGRREEVARRVEPIVAMFKRLDCLVIGPGMGRDPLLVEIVAGVIHAITKSHTQDQEHHHHDHHHLPPKHGQEGEDHHHAKHLRLVLDADALQLVAQRPELVRGNPNVVLTPNVVEFQRLCKAFDVDLSDRPSDNSPSRLVNRAAELSARLGGVAIVQKGGVDIVVGRGAREAFWIDTPGGRKRSGGQGDTLTGCIATFLAWEKAYRVDRLWQATDTDVRENTKMTTDIAETSAGDWDSFGVAIAAGSMLTKECSRLAFRDKGRSLQASDLTDHVHTAFLSLFQVAE